MKTKTPYTAIAAIFSASVFLSSGYLITLYSLVYTETVKTTITRYLNRLQKNQPHNSFLKLFSKNIDQTLNKEYLLSSVNKLLVVYISVFLLMSLMILSLIALEHKISNSKTRDDAPQKKATQYSQIAIFNALFFATTTATICASILLAHKFVDNNAANLMIKYIDNSIPNQGTNPFLETFKRIIKSTFKATPDNNLILEIKSRFYIISGIVASVSMLICIFAISYLIYQNKTPRTAVHYNTDSLSKNTPLVQK